MRQNMELILSCPWSMTRIGNVVTSISKKAKLKHRVKTLTQGEALAFLTVW